MTDIYRCMFVRAADVAVARAIAVGLSPVGGAGMWNLPVSSNGQEPATYYWDSGFIGPEWATIMPLQTWGRDQDGNWQLLESLPGDPVALFTACQQAGLAITQQQITDLYNNSDVTIQPPTEVLARLGLQSTLTGDTP